MINCLDCTIPSTAKEIKVRSIFSPYFIRALDVIEDREKKKKLMKLLMEVSDTYFKKRTRSDYVPKICDCVVISASYLNNENVDLPNWICRGTVVDVSETTADVFFDDYGIVVNIPIESIAKYPQNAVPVEPLSYTLGINNILPIDLKKNVCKNWPRNVVDYMKFLMENAKKIYFDVQAHDKSTGRIFGDFFLVINKKNLCLSQFLIKSHMAVELNDELLQAEKECESGSDLKLGKTCEKQSNFSSENERSILKSTDKVKNLRKEGTLLIDSKVLCEPIIDVADARFATSIHKALRNSGIRRPKEMQSYMWPAIKQGLNVTAIAPPSSGKASGYVVPIMNAIFENKEMLGKQKRNLELKPIVLVLCPTVKTCVDTCHDFNCVVKVLAKSQKSIGCCTLHTGMDDKLAMTKVLNNCQVVVATPSFLLRLLSKKFSPHLNLSELSYLVIDHADIILKKYLKEVISLIRDHKIINKNFTNCIQGIASQIITVARTWTSEIHSFVSNFVENSYTCIGSLTEAVVYSGGVQGRMLICHSDRKKHQVLEAVKEYATQKTMIFCLDSTEACELNQFLLDNNVQTLLVHEDMKYTQIEELKSDLKKSLPGMFPAIICTDAVLSEFPVLDAEYLIHYSVTNTSKSTFNRRLSVLMENWSLESDEKCRILILFDETKDSIHFKGVVDILKRFKVNIPQDWDIIADGLEIQDNIKKKNYPLCNNIKSFGYCSFQYCNTKQSCPDRHLVIAESDAPQIPDISIGDNLKLYITHKHSVTHYSARILEYTKEGIATSNTEVQKPPHEIAKLSTNLKSYYNIRGNRRSPKEIVPGLICIAKKVQSYSRVKILQIVDKNVNSNKPTIVKYQSIDDGEICNRALVSELYEISEEFLNYKLAIVNVYLTGVSPFDEENEWGESAINVTQKWFDENLKNNSYISAKVLLHIGDSIWTDSLVICSKIRGYSDLVTSSLKQTIIGQGQGIDNKKHLAHLVHLCISSGLTKVNGQPIELPKDTQEKEH